MTRLFLALFVLLAACGGSSTPAATTAARNVSSESAPPTMPETTTTTEPDGPSLVARCGAVELPVSDVPILPSEPLDGPALEALEQAKQVVGVELELFDFYDWAIAERSADRLVLFGMATSADVAAEVPYGDMVLVRTDDGWRPEGWGQCHIQVRSDVNGNAVWVLDAEPDAHASQLSVLINERECANGEPPIGREIIPVVVMGEDLVTITVLVEPVSGGASCPSNPWHPITIDLGEPLGNRQLRDGSTIPPRVQEWPVSQEFLDSRGSSG